VTRKPVQLPNSDNFPPVPAERRKVRRRPRKAASAMLPVAQDYAAVGLLVFPLWPDRFCWRRWLTACIGLRLLRVVCRTRCGQAT